MGMVFEPIRPVPPITTIFIANLPVRSPHAAIVMILRQAAVSECGPPRETRQCGSTETGDMPHLLGAPRERDRIPVGVVDQDRPRELPGPLNGNPVMSDGNVLLDGA